MPVSQWAPGPNSGSCRRTSMPAGGGLLGRWWDRRQIDAWLALLSLSMLALLWLVYAGSLRHGAQDGTVGGLPPAVAIVLVPAALALLAPVALPLGRWLRIGAAALMGLCAFCLALIDLNVLPASGVGEWAAATTQMAAGPVGLPALATYLLSLAIAACAEHTKLPAGLVLVLQSISGLAAAVCGIGWLLLGIGAAAFGAPAILRWAPGWTLLTLVALGWNLRVARSAERQAFTRDRPDRTALLHNLMALAIASYAAGLIATGVFAAKVVETIQPLLLQGTAGHAAALQRQLDHLANEAATGAARAASLVSPAADPDIVGNVRRALAAHGPPEVQIHRDGAPAAELAVPIRGPKGVDGWLRSLDGSKAVFVIPASRDTRLAIGFAGQGVSPLLDYRVLNLHAETLVCSPLQTNAAQCLTGSGTASMPLPPRSDGRDWPMQQAWAGKSGVMLTLDRFGNGVAVAFAPVPGWDLGVAHKLGASALLRSLSAQVMLAVSVLGAFAVVAARLLFQRSHAMVRELRFSRAYADATFDALPQVLLTLDSQHRILRASGASRALFGVEPSSLDGRLATTLFEAGAMPTLPASSPAEAVVARDDGSRCEVEVLSRPLQFEGRTDRILILRDISADKRYLDSLRRWESIFRQAGWGAVVYEVEDERIELTNSAFAKLYGRTPEEMLGMRFGDLFTEESLAEFRTCGDHVTNGDRRVVTATHRRCDGSQFPVLVDSTLLRAPNGSPQARVAVVQDLTELRRAEQEMRDARLFFERVFDTAPMGMLVAHRDGRLLKINAALARFLERDAGALVQQTLVDLVAPERRDAARVQMTSVLAGCEVGAAIELPFLRQDGSQVWGLLVVAPVRAAGEEDRLVGQVLDVDERRRIREALLQSEASLAQAEQMAHLGHWRWVPGEDSAWCSRQALRILGLTDEGSPNRALSELVRRAHPDDLRTLQAALRRALEGGPDVDIDHRIVRGDGSERLVHQTARVVPEAPGRPRHLLWTIQDITDSKTIEHELRSSRQALRELLANDEGILEEERKRIAREIHDELGQLLTALRMDVSLLRLASADRPEVLSLSGGMLAKLDETIAVVRHLATHLRPAALDIGLIPALEWLVEDFSHRWEIHCDLVHHGIDGPIDDVVATAVFRMVQECLTNVARHARADAVRVAIERQDKHLRVTVSDNGVGFDPGAPRRHGCFGLLGMKERALKAGGSLDIESLPGQGTRVLIELAID